MLVAVAAGLVFSLIAVTTPAQAAVAWCRDVKIRSLANGKAVAAELTDSAFPGMLRARTDWNQVGPWEKFQLCYHTGTPYGSFHTLRSVANGLYVSNEQTFGGKYQFMLRARSGSIGAWERWRLEVYKPDLEQYYIRWHAHSTAAGNYVSAELGADYIYSDHAMLRARASKGGAWERFSVLNY